MHTTLPSSYISESGISFMWAFIVIFIKSWHVFLVIITSLSPVNIYFDCQLTSRKNVFYLSSVETNRKHFRRKWKWSRSAVSNSLQPHGLYVAY